ncbi:MAG: chemotaxis protein CheB [Deltaproteobacteria bacterium]|nr:chemotaxis protein CheB [Deltaproteobacteria bacterium]
MGVSVVVVGASLGGFSALKVLLSGLPKDFGAPIVIVQHRGKTADGALADLLGEETPLPVSEPNDKDPLAAGRVYVAPADYHLLVEPGHLALSMDAPVGHSRPSIDILFESAAEAYGSLVVAVLLTGANEDGARGCMRVKERGGVVLVEDPADARSSVMPAAAIRTTIVDRVLPLSELPSVLAQLCREPVR